MLKDVPVLFELPEKPQQFKHGSVLYLCVRVLTLGWGMITNLTLDRIGNKAEEHWINRDRLQSPPSFVIKKPCTLHTLNKGEISYCLKPVVKMLLHPKSLPISNTPQSSVFRLKMASVLHAFALLCSRGFLRSVLTGFSAQVWKPYNIQMDERLQRSVWTSGYSSELHSDVSPWGVQPSFFEP